MAAKKETLTGELLKVISGGQTGVDRGALDAALALEVECGGWCPAGRLAEDGTIPKRYPVVELANAGYAERTARNVADSDGTLIISNGEPIGGTRETIDRCIEMEKPHLIIDHPMIPTDETVELVLRFVADHQIRVLNVAGPRASQWPDGHQTAEQIVSAVLRRLKWT
jgi:Circularly permutated YpsA SLOG family